MISSEEKRKSVRIPVDLEAHFTVDKKEYPGRVLNLSIDGAFFKAQHLLDADDTFEFTFHIPGGKHPVKALARVVWGGSIEGAAVRAFGMGIRFEDLGFEYQREIADYIDRLLKA